MAINQSNTLIARRPNDDPNKTDCSIFCSYMCLHDYSASSMNHDYHHQIHCCCCCCCYININTFELDPKLYSWLMIRAFSSSRIFLKLRSSSFSALWLDTLFVKPRKFYIQPITKFHLQTIKLLKHFSLKPIDISICFQCLSVFQSPLAFDDDHDYHYDSAALFSAQMLWEKCFYSLRIQFDFSTQFCVQLNVYSWRRCA